MKTAAPDRRPTPLQQLGGVSGLRSSLVLAVVFLASVFLRRPLVGVIWGALSGRDRRWRADSRSLVAFDIATLALATVLAARFVVQNWLYGADETGWLAVARIAMGYPLIAAALVIVFWAARRAGRRLDPPGTPPAQSPTTTGRRPLG